MTSTSALELALKDKPIELTIFPGIDVNLLIS